MVGASLWAGGVAQAQSNVLYWDSNAGLDQAQDGAGTWIENDFNFPSWLPSPTAAQEENTVWPAGSAGFDTVAVFGNGGFLSGAATVNVSGTVNAGGIRFNGLDPDPANAAYTITGGTIQLATGARIVVGDTASNTGTGRITISSALGGSNITLVNEDVDLGLLRLSGNNLWTGTLALENTSALGGLFAEVLNYGSLSSLSAIEVRANSTLALNYTQTDALAMPLTLTGTGAGGRGAIRFDRNLTVSGPVTLAGSAGIAVNATGTTGTISGNIGESVVGSALTINSNTVAGTIVLSGNNTFTGGVILQAGRLRLASAGALNATGLNLITFGTGTSTIAKTLELDGFSVTVAGLSNATTTTNSVIENASATAATLTLRNDIDRFFRGNLQDGTGGGALSLVKAGSATQRIAGASTYTGSTTINAGTLQLDFSAAGAAVNHILNNTANSSALILGGGTLRLTGSGAAANAQRFNGLQVTAGSSTVVLATNATPQDLLLSLGAITRTGGSVNFVLPAGAVSATNGITTTSTNTNGILGAWATVNGTNWATVSGGNIVANTVYSDVNRLGGVIPNTPAANVRIVEAGTTGPVTLAAATTDINTLLYSATGAGTISFGAAPFGNTLRLGQVGGILMATGSGSLTIGEAVDEGSVLTAGGSTAGVAGELLISHFSTGTLTINSDITNNGAGAVSLSHGGTGLTVLTSTFNTYSGGTFINGGTLRVSSNGSLGFQPAAVQANNLTFNGGTLQWGAAFALDSRRGITLLDGGGTLDTQTFATVYAGIITGTGPLTKQGTGTLTLTQANTYTGTTTVGNGILAVANNNALGSTAGATFVSAAGIVQLQDGITVTGETITINGVGTGSNGNLQTVSGVVGTPTSATWAGDVIIGTNAARVGTGTNSTLTITGVIRSGTGIAGLGVSASSSGGTVVLAGANTYAGATSVIRGTLKLGADNSLPAGTELQVHSTDLTSERAAFDLAGFDQTIAGLSGVVRAAPTSTNKTSVTNSSLEESTLTVNQTSNTEYFGEITGAIALVKAGAGTLTLENQAGALSNSYTGKTTISGGTLALRNAGNLDGTPWIQIDAGATLSITGRTDGAYTLGNKILSGTGSVNGSLTVNGTSVIRPGSTGAGGTSASAGTGTGTLTFNNLTIAPVGAGMDARVYLQLGGTTSNLFSAEAAGDATYYSTASSEGLYDSLNVTGTLGLNAGSTISVTLTNGYTLGYGDVFNLMDWAILNADADGAGGAGSFTVADLDLSGIALSGGMSFNTDQFLSHGIIYVVPEPSRMLLLGAGLFSLLLRRKRTLRPASGHTTGHPLSLP